VPSEGFVTSITRQAEDSPGSHSDIVLKAQLVDYRPIARQGRAHCQVDRQGTARRDRRPPGRRSPLMPQEVADCAKGLNDVASRTAIELVDVEDDRCVVDFVNLALTKHLRRRAWILPHRGAEPTSLASAGAHATPRAVSQQLKWSHQSQSPQSAPAWPHPHLASALTSDRPHRLI
jgi:hypothetical protein